MPKDGPNDMDDTTESEPQIVRRRMTLISASDEEESKGPKRQREERLAEHESKKVKKPHLSPRLPS